MNIRFIGVSEIDKYMKNEKVRFIDLRNVKEYRKKHIRGAISMPYDMFEKKYHELSQKNIYVLYCDRGSLSVMAADLMQKKGYKCFSLAGGMHRFCLQLSQKVL